ncbi:MAG: hypothetical protein JWN88_2222 [Frankiales bacterium]|nr:hypothetical protein [Frankiales bacterium]
MIVQRRLQLIVNPSAGGGRSARALPGVERALREAGHDLRTTLTTSLRHADELTEQALYDERVPVAMGGDGIAGRVAGALSLLTPHVAQPGLMGVLPGGRGNDLCRAVGLPRDPVAACAVLGSGVPRALDLGVVSSATGDVPFLGIAGIGFDSEVQERVLTSRLRLGQAVYLYGALATVARWRPARFACRVDGSPFDVEGWTVAVCNSGRYGGGMRLAPDASTEDGVLDVVAIATSSRTHFLRTLPKVFRGTHVSDASVSVRPARKVELSADRPFRVFADGDPAGVLPCTVTVRPAAVRLLLPAGGG